RGIAVALLFEPAEADLQVGLRPELGGGRGDHLVVPVDRGVELTGVLQGPAGAVAGVVHPGAAAEAVDERFVSLAGWLPLLLGAEVVAKPQKCAIGDTGDVLILPLIAERRQSLD